MATTKSGSERFAQTDDEAEQRYSKFRAKDPFPNIEPALLNSADIADYVATTGMIVPFDPEEMKPASYGVRLGGKCVYWDENKKKREFMLTKTSSHAMLVTKSEIRLQRNSITFVTLVPTFRLPQYIAMRFNLKIKNVYRGLLLGTGPLVDPGFHGKLSFPLHNLTNDEYTLRADDVVIYAEFTKLSHWRNWERGRDWDRDLLGAASERREGVYHELDGEKLSRKDIDDYLAHATDGNPVASSIPQEVRGIEERVSKAEELVERARSLAEDVRNETRRRWDRTLIGVGVTAFLGVIGSVYAIEQVRVSADQISQAATNDASETKIKLLQLSNQTKNQFKEQADGLTSIKKAVDDYQMHLERIDLEMRSLSATLSAISDKSGRAGLDELRQEVDGMKRQLSDMRSTTVPVRPK